MSTDVVSLRVRRQPPPRPNSLGAKLSGFVRVWAIRPVCKISSFASPFVLFHILHSGGGDGEAEGSQGGARGRARTMQTSGRRLRRRRGRPVRRPTKERKAEALLPRCSMSSSLELWHRNS